MKAAGTMFLSYCIFVCLCWNVTDIGVNRRKNYMLLNVGLEQLYSYISPIATSNVGMIFLIDL